MLNIEEIKARHEAATPGPWYLGMSGANFEGFSLEYHIATVYNKKIYAQPPGGQFPAADADFIAHARTDIPELLAEVERLTAENQQNADYAEIYKDICDKYGKNFRTLLDKAKVLQVENDDLTQRGKMWKAIAIAQKSEKATLKKALELAVNLMRDSKVPVTVESFIQQAQQLTHVSTHGESEAGK